MELQEVLKETDSDRVEAALQEQMDKELKQTASMLLRFKKKVVTEYSTDHVLVIFSKLIEDPFAIHVLLDEYIDEGHQIVTTIRRRRSRSLKDENYEDEAVAVRNLNAMIKIRSIWMELWGMIDHCFRSEDDMTLEECIQKLEEVL